MGRAVTAMMSVLVMVVGLQFVGVAPAAADHTAGGGDQRPCVSAAEYHNIRFWWPPATQVKVTDHFDTFGTRVRSWNRGRDQVWAYRKCATWGWGRVYVWYDNYSWGDRRYRVYAMAPNHGAFSHWSWQRVQ